MKIVYTIGLAVLMLGCSTKSEVKKQIDDLLHVPQSTSYYSKVLDSDGSKMDQGRFESQYFSVWNIETPKETKEDVQWAFNVFKAGNSYAENLKLHKNSFFDEMKENSQYEKYSSLNRRAIALKELNIRAFPTMRPLLRDPEKAGEGFPFDYLQNSTIHANKPLFATHYSRDREWVHIVSSFAYGWVKSDEIVFLEEKHTDLWQKAEQVVVIKEGVPIYSLEGDFLFKSKIGMMFALISEDENYYTVLTVSSYKSSQPLYLHSKISKDTVHKGVLSFNSKNINIVFDEMLKSNYGWGGMYGQRDCSSTLRDAFIPFGIWLPRNSLQQSKLGDVISLEGLSDEAKIATIKEKATAFKTLLYKQGHIVLYVGTYKGKVVVFQNTWGIKTDKDGIEGRFIVGKTLFSTLQIGEDLKEYDEDAGLLRNLKSMNTFH